MLADENFVVEISKPSRAYIPAFDIDKMSVYDVLHKLKYKGDVDKKMMEKLLENEKIKELVNDSETALKEAFEGVTVKALIT